MSFLPILTIFVLTFAPKLFAQEQPLAKEEPSVSAQESKSEADIRKELLGTVRVSKVHSIDEVKGSYKSPRQAMFMSLIVPGSGQMYVGTKQSRYIRGAFYMAEEIALISGLYYYSIYKYNKRVKEYQNFAKEHFSVTKYETEMNSIYRQEYKEAFLSLYGQERDSYCKSLYGNSSASSTCVNNFGENFNSTPGDNTPYNTREFNEREFYRIIANENFILGWSDATSNADDIKATLEHYDNPEYMSLGESEYYNEYLIKRNKANKLANKQVIFLGAIILNHIVSAVDAAITARAHNNSLYEEKLSFFDRIRLGSSFDLSENFRARTELVYIF